MEVTLEPDLLSPTMLGVEMIELIELIILIPFKPKFEMGLRGYMFVRKEFTVIFFFKPLAQEGRIQGAGGCWVFLNALRCSWMLVEACGCSWMLLDAPALAPA